MLVPKYLQLWGSQTLKNNVILDGLFDFSGVTPLGWFEPDDLDLSMQDEDSGTR